MLRTSHARIELAEWLVRFTKCASAYNKPDKRAFRILYLALRERVQVSLVSANPPIRRIPASPVDLVPPEIAAEVFEVL